MDKSFKNFVKTLKRDLVILDTETTGVDQSKDEVIQLHCTKISKTGENVKFGFKCKPSFKIPAGATEVHGITNEDVAEMLPFSNYAQSFIAFIDGCDIAGYNVSFDINIVDRQLAQLGKRGIFENRLIYDAFSVYKRHHPRNLSAAVEFYTGNKLEAAHDASADVIGTLNVIIKQVEKEGKDLASIISDSEKKAQFEHIIMVDGEPTLNFSKYKGTALKDVDKSFLSWVMSKDFPQDLKKTIKAYL